jgi:hypothetical protein
MDSQIEYVNGCYAFPSRRRQSFLVFPSGRLKYFRSNLESG